MLELRAAPKQLEVLYNDFAIPSQVCGAAAPPLCLLGNVHLAGFSTSPHPHTLAHALSPPCRTGGCAWKWCTWPASATAPMSASYGTWR